MTRHMRQSGSKPINMHGPMSNDAMGVVEEWLARLAKFGISRQDFDREQHRLSEQFGFRPPLNDTVWSILNKLVVQSVPEYVRARVYLEMARLVALEGRKNLKQYLSGTSPWLWGQEEFAIVRELRKKGKLREAEQLLLWAEPSPASLDESRKIASTKARQKAKEGDWAGVVEALKGYNQLAEKWRAYCLEMVNQAPPEHTSADLQLLQKAEQKVSG